jgi:hypothetical protein
MATPEAITKLFESLVDFDLASAPSWSAVGEFRLAILPHHVAVTGSDVGELGERIAWLESAHGPRIIGLTQGRRMPADASWSFGCWDWSVDPTDHTRALFLFLDPTDAFEFKLRWS